MEQNKEDLRVCRKCLMRELAGQEETFRSMWEYIENLDMEIKASQSLYEKRLAICKECDMLLQGMCRKCGCYVEMRAAVVKNSCPGKLW